MKLNGKKIDRPNEEIIVIPRGDDDPLVFHARAVLSYEEFNKLCPTPEPPNVQKAGESGWFKDYEDTDYLAELRAHNLQEWNWMIYQSLLATPDLEFETIKAGDPDTWSNLEKEFKDAGFTPREINLIIDGVLTANALNEDKLEQARKSFLSGGVKAPNQ